MSTIKEKIRYLRKNQTPAEKILWNKLRNRRLFGYRFIRQYPLKIMIPEGVQYFIADFYCAKKKLAIEVDGKWHDEQKKYDEARTKVFNKYEIIVLRFRNSDVENNLDQVLKHIETYLRS